MLFYYLTTPRSTLHKGLKLCITSHSSPYQPHRVRPRSCGTLSTENTASASGMRAVAPLRPGPPFPFSPSSLLLVFPILMWPPPMSDPSASLLPASGASRTAAAADSRSTCHRTGRDASTLACSPPWLAASCPTSHQPDREPQRCITYIMRPPAAPSLRLRSTRACHAWTCMRGRGLLSVDAGLAQQACMPERCICSACTHATVASARMRMAAARLLLKSARKVAQVRRRQPAHVREQQAVQRARVLQEQHARQQCQERRLRAAATAAAPVLGQLRQAIADALRARGLAMSAWQWLAGSRMQRAEALFEKLAAVPAAPAAAHACCSHCSYSLMYSKCRAAADG